MCIYIKSVRTRHGDFLHLRGHFFAACGNHKFAIAGFSWQIVHDYGRQQKENTIGKMHSIRDRGDEYRNNGNIIRALEDYVRCERIYESLQNSGLENTHVYEDLWLAITMGGTTNAVRFANRGMISIAEGAWDQALQDFHLAIEADFYLADAYTNMDHAIYNEGIDEFKYARALDIAAAKAECCRVPKRIEAHSFQKSVKALVNEFRPVSKSKLFFYHVIV